MYLMCSKCPSLPNRMGLSGCKISHPLLPLPMAYYQPRHGNQMMVLPPDRTPETHGRILENFIIETHSASTFLAYLSIFMLCFPVDALCMGSFFACLHLFGHLIKTYYSSIIPIVLYLTYFTVPDIVSSSPLHGRFYHDHL